MISPDKNCTACGACAQVCPKSCISLKEDEYGFVFPFVNASGCIGCGMCETACHLNINTSNCRTDKAFACAHRSADVVKKSTSGGVFTAIAEKIFSLGGVVYGCGYITPTEPRHIRIDRIDNIDKLRGSKYVQSKIGDSYKNVLSDLRSDKWVLFTGTPCQIAGLKAFLGKHYDKLLTADIICHGVPSSAYFKKFIDWYEKKHRCTVKEFDFRSKENSGWSCAGICHTEKNGVTDVRKAFYFDNYYYCYFLDGEIYRDSCYNCKYANLNRTGDFTLGDFWGAEGQNLGFDIADGCSLVLLNTEKAKAIFAELNINSTEVNIDYAVSNNAQLKAPSTHTELRNVLLEEFRNCSGEEINGNFIKIYRRKRIKARLKYALPKSVRGLLLKIKYSRKGKF